MGYFTEYSNNPELSAKDVDKSTASSGMRTHTFGGLLVGTYGVQGLTKGITEIGNLLRGDGKETPSDEDMTAVYQDDLEKALSAIGAKGPDDINEAVARQEEKSNKRIQEAQDKVNELGSSASIQSQINELRLQSQELSKTPGSEAKIKELDSQIKDLQKKYDKAVKAEEKLQEVIAAEATRMEGVNKNAQAAFEALRNIASISGSEETVDIEEEKESLKTFNEKRNAFVQAAKSDNPNLADMKKLAGEVTEFCDNLSQDDAQNGTIQKGYEALKKFYPQYFKAA